MILDLLEQGDHEQMNPFPGARNPRELYNHDVQGLEPSSISAMSRVSQAEREMTYGQGLRYGAEAGPRKTFGGRFDWQKAYWAPPMIDVHTAH